MKNRKVIILVRLEQTVGNMESYENQYEFALAYFITSGIMSN